MASLDCLVVGNPNVPNMVRLPHAEKEAIEVASIMGVKAIIGEEATISNIVPELHKCVYLYRGD